MIFRASSRLRGQFTRSTDCLVALRRSWRFISLTRCALNVCLAPLEMLVEATTTPSSLDMTKYQSPESTCSACIFPVSAFVTLSDSSVGISFTLPKCTNEDRRVVHVDMDLTCSHEMQVHPDIRRIYDGTQQAPPPSLVLRRAWKSVAHSR